MRERWLPVGIVAAGLFLINAIARFVVWQTDSKNDTTQITIGLIVFGLIGLVMIGTAVRWGMRYPMPRVSGDLAVVILASGLLSVAVGPFAGGSVPFVEGAHLVIAEIWQYVGYSAAGAVLGLLSITALGLDYRSRALKQYANAKLAKPNRVVRH